MIAKRSQIVDSQYLGGRPNGGTLVDRRAYCPWSNRHSQILFFGPRGQQFTQPGPFGPGIDPTKIAARPEGPLRSMSFKTEFSAIQASVSVIKSLSRAEGPWLGELLAQLGRRRKIKRIFE